MSKDEQGAKRGTAPPRVVAADELAGLVGRHLGHSRWHRVSQEQVERFAAVTGDRQWIHVDRKRAEASPLGGTIAHGYLTLALGPALLKQIVRVEPASRVINYGLNRVRFPSVVPVGSRVRLGAELDALERQDSYVQATYRLTFEVEGSEKPCCVAEVLFRYYV